MSSQPIISILLGGETHGVSVCGTMVQVREAYICKMNCAVPFVRSKLSSESWTRGRASSGAN
jgi:hypothetical protein